MGLRFQTDREFPIGENLELSIHWPAMLNDVTPLQFVVVGRIVRSTEVDTAVQMVSYEFRTRTLEDAVEGRHPVRGSAGIFAGRPDNGIQPRADHLRA